MAGKTNRILWIAALAALALSAPACVGDVPDPVEEPDPDPDPDPDPLPDPETLDVTGTVVPYFEAMRGLAPLGIAAEIATEGITPAMSVVSATDGTYSLIDVPAAGVFFVDVIGTPGIFRPTRNTAITVVDQSIEQPLYAVEDAAVVQQYLGAGNVPMTPLSAFAIVDIQNDLGIAIENINPADITLIDNGVVPPAIVALDPATQGPYFFGALGDLVSLADQPASGVFLVGGVQKARAGLLNLPPGNYTLQIVDNNVDPPMTYTTPLRAGPDSVTLARVGGPELGGTPPLGDPLALTFTNDIYPMIQKASLGGLGCAACHTAGGQGAVFVMDAGVDLVHAELTDLNRIRPLISLIVVESEFLMNPVYEDPPNHPNATFASVLSPGYVTFMNWIEQGAVK